MSSMTTRVRRKDAGGNKIPLKTNSEYSFAAKHAPHTRRYSGDDDQMNIRLNGEEFVASGVSNPELDALDLSILREVQSPEREIDVADKRQSKPKRKKRDSIKRGSSANEGDLEALAELVPKLKIGKIGGGALSDAGEEMYDIDHFGNDNSLQGKKQSVSLSPSRKSASFSPARNGMRHNESRIEDDDFLDDHVSPKEFRNYMGQKNGTDRLQRRDEDILNFGSMAVQVIGTVDDDGMEGEEVVHQMPAVRNGDIYDSALSEVHEGPHERVSLSKTSLKSSHDSKSSSSNSTAGRTASSDANNDSNHCSKRIAGGNNFAKNLYKSHSGSDRDLRRPGESLEPLVPGAPSGGLDFSNIAPSSASLSTATQTHEVKMPMYLPTFKPATGCTNASDFIVRCFVARLHSGITVVKHGRSRWCKSRLRVLHVHSDGRSLSWRPAPGEPSSNKRPPKLDLSTCTEVRHAWSPDPLNPMFTGTQKLRHKCEAANAHKSFALIFPKRTVDITAVTADQCKVLMEGFSALCFRLQVANLAGRGKKSKEAGAAKEALGEDDGTTASVTLTNNSTTVSPTSGGTISATALQKRSSRVR